MILIAQLFWPFPTGNGDSDHLVIGQSDDAEKLSILSQLMKKIAISIVILYFLHFFLTKLRINKYGLLLLIMTKLTVYDLGEQVNKFGILMDKRNIK